MMLSRQSARGDLAGHILGLDDIPIACCHIEILCLTDRQSPQAPRILRQNKKGETQPAPFAGYRLAARMSSRRGYALWVTTPPSLNLRSNSYSTGRAW